MKKLSKEQKTYWLCRLKKNEAKKHKGSRRKKSYKMTRVYTPKSSATLIQAPENFQLNPKKNRTKTLAFFESLRAAVKSKKDITIDFRETSMMFADASILLKAEIERLMQYFPSMKWKCVLPKSNRTKQVLYQIDLLNILKCNHHITVDRDDVMYWKHAHGNLVEGEKYDIVLGKYDGTLADSLTKGLYTSITEAMGNSCEHAYIISRDDKLHIKQTSNDWWMFSQQHNGMLSVAFCDLGAGIPRTISKTRKPLWEVIKQRCNIEDDADVIHFATGSGKSRTEKTYRGKGLPQLVKNIMNVKNSALRIFSNQGVVTYRPNQKPNKETFKTSIYGTVIVWEIPITQEGKP